MSSSKMASNRDGQPMPTETWERQSLVRVDPAALMRVKNLQWRAQTIVDGFQSGLHRSPLHGFSVEFSEYRPYAAGDDPKTIDWKLYARSDRFHVKKFEDETNRRCFLVLDQSRSMAFGSKGYSKLDYATTLAATLAYYLSQQRDAVGAITFEESVTGMIPARYKTGQIKRLFGLFERAPSGVATDLLKPLAQLAEWVRHRSLILILSDFLVPLDGLETPLAYLRARKHDVMLLRVLDPAEVAWSFSEPTMVRDMESGREVYLDPESAKQTYQRRFSEHANSLREMAERKGIGLRTMITTQPLEDALFELIHPFQEVRKVRMRTPRGSLTRNGGKP